VGERSATATLGENKAMAAGEDANDREGDPGPLRASASEIYERVKREAGEELDRPVAALAFSGLFAGASVGFGVVAEAAAAAALPGHHDARLIGAIFFPIGFIVVIIGRAQRFTENTLYPVTLVRRAPPSARDAAHLGDRARRESPRRVVVRFTGDQDASTCSRRCGEGRRERPTRDVRRLGIVFLEPVLGGWAIALVAWLIQSSAVVIGQIVLIWTLVFVVGLVELDHSVSTTIAVLCAVFRNEVDLGHALAWFAAVVLGNIAGGVLITAVLNDGQVRAGEG
jgi:formate-nitrite transporter family protein